MMQQQAQQMPQMQHDQQAFIPQPSRSPELQRRTTSPNGNWGAQQQQQRGGGGGGGNNNGFGMSPGRAAHNSGAGRGPTHAPSAQSVRVEGSAPMGDYGRNNGYGIDDFNTPGYGQGPPARPTNQRNPVGNPQFRTGY
jgi:hypothetical protein